MMQPAAKLTTDTWQRVEAWRENSKPKPWKEIARTLHVHPDTLRARYSERKRKVIPISSSPWFNVKVGGHSVVIDAPRYTDMMVCQGDAVVIADVHLVSTDWDLLHLPLDVARKHMRKGQRKLIIAGDLINNDALSTHARYVNVPPLSHELETAAALLKEFAATFDQIWYIMGNHEQRLAAALNGELDGTALGRIVAGGLGGKLRISNLRQMWLHSVTGLWRITHQRNYSRIKGRVGAALAAKHQTNVITHHEHGIALLMDEHARYTVVNNPALCNYEAMHYVMGADSTSPTMANGFTFMQNGRPYLMTPYENFTDWEKWKLANEAQPAIAAAERRAARLIGRDVSEFLKES